MDTSKPRNRRKLKARAARWAATKQAETEIRRAALGPMLGELMYGTSNARPKGLLHGH